MIEFLCPNGHKIRCQAAHAGRAAKCPRCGVKFCVPELTDQNRSHVADSEASGALPNFADSGVGGMADSRPAAPPPASATFEFLCPNGHRLHGPASLQGRPGQCPECGSRFRIPTYEDVPPDEEIEQDIGRGRPGDEESQIGAAATQGSGTERTTSAVFARLWKTRPEGATVELRLRSGEIVLLKEFLAKAAEETEHGVFAVPEADATVSLVVIPWTAIDRMTIRGLSEMPSEWAK